MAITFTWSVKDMHKITATGAVYKVDWSCSGVDDDTSTSRSRSGTYQHTVEVTETINVAEETETVDVAEETLTYDVVTGQDSDGNDVTESVTIVVTPARTITNVTPAHTITNVTPAYTKIVPVTPDHTASDFVAYDALDEATVLGWIKDNGVQAYNEGLITTNINNLIAATAANSTGMPWAAE